MSSACISNIGVSPDNFSDCSSTNRIPGLLDEPDPDLSDIVDFEFRLDDSVMMLPADQLLSDGKLILLNLPEATSSTTSVTDTPNPHRKMNGDGVSVADPVLYSPKAAQSRWNKLLGLRKLYQNNNSNVNGATKSFKHFLHRSSKSTNDSSVNLPLLNDTDNETTSRPSLCSDHDPDELPRLSIDSEKSTKANLNTNPNNLPKMRIVKTRTPSVDASVSMESPRMNSSGKIVFQSLERSSSSPSSFNNGGSRITKHRGGIERSYSGNVRVAPILNVPVCSIRGSVKSGGVFGLPLFSSSSHKKPEGSSSGSNGGSTRNQQRKTDRS